MKINQKLLSGFLTISLLTLLVSYVIGMAVQKETIDNFEEVGGELLPGNLAMARMTTEIYHSLELLTRYTKSRSLEDKQALEKTVATLSQYQTIHMLYHMHADEENWHHEIDGLMQRFSSFITQYLLLMQKGGGEEELDRIKNKIDEVLDDFATRLNPYIENEFNKGFSILEATKKKNERARHLLIISSLVILIVVIFFSLFVSHMLAKPILKLRDAAREIGRGKLDIELPPASEDEIGELAQEFNGMTKSLSAAQNELISARDYIDDIVNSMGDTLIVIAPSGEIQKVNAAACSLSGFEEDEIVGQPLQKIIEADEVLFTLTDLPALVRNEAIQSLNVLFRTKSGEKIPVSLTGSPMYDETGDIQAVILVARDIRELSKLLDELHATNQQLQSEVSERTKTEQALLESERNYKEILNATSEAIFLHDAATGEILDVNQTMLEMYGYTYEESLDLSLRELGSNEPPYTQKKAIEFVKKAVVEGPQVFDWQARRKNGEIFWVEVSLKSSEIGGYGRVLAVVRDISGRKEIEKELRQAQKMEAIGTLAGGIAHDFNNILTAIVGFSQLAKRLAKDDPKVTGYLEKVITSSRRAENLVMQILTFSRMTEQEKKPLQLSLIIKEVLQMLRHTIPSTIEIKSNIQSQGTAMADPTQIHQIVMNLSTNAYHSMRETGGTLAVSLTEVELTAKDYPLEDIVPGKYLRLEISDTGVGMDAETRAKIFEPYFTTKEAGKGTGLGLAVVHGIVSDHNGHITVYSEPGKGSTFHVYLPLIEEPAADFMGPKEEEGPSGGNERIIFIDDEDAIVEFAVAVLTENGYSVTTFTNGMQALQEFARKPDDFDLVITDMTMPYMTGADLAKEILAIKASVPIILCSGYSELVNREKALAMGIAEYIQKPILIDNFLRSVRQVLDKK